MCLNPLAGPANRFRRNPAAGPRAGLPSIRTQTALSNLAELRKQLESLGKDPNREINLMRNRRAELAKQLRSAVKDDPRYFTNVNLIKDRLTATVINIGDLLWPWSILQLPTMADGINQTPTASGTSGEIATSGLFQGTGAWGGMPENAGTQEQWWVHNWTCTAVLPPAPHQGTEYHLESLRFAGHRGVTDRFQHSCAVPLAQVPPQSELQWH
jgi:hypothetical protein